MVEGVHRLARVKHDPYEVENVTGPDQAAIKMLQLRADG
jgi:hypothetical protein